MIIKNTNFSGKTDNIPQANEYHNCNFSQPTAVYNNGWVPVKIFTDDDTPKKFLDCNLVNATPPVGSICEGCTMTIIETRPETDTDGMIQIIHGFLGVDLTPTYKPAPIVMQYEKVNIG